MPGQPTAIPGRITAADVDYKSAQNGTSNLHVDYSNFKSVGVKMFPATLNLTMTTTATRKKQEAKINLELNEVKTDSKWEHSDRDFRQIQADFSNRCAQQDIEYVDAHQEFEIIEHEFLI